MFFSTKMKLMKVRHFWMTMIFWKMVVNYKEILLVIRTARSSCSTCSSLNSCNLRIFSRKSLNRIGYIFSFQPLTILKLRSCSQKISWENFNKKKIYPWILLPSIQLISTMKNDNEKIKTVYIMNILVLKIFFYESL